MARKPRVEFPGAFYHVISRGNQRQTLFHDVHDQTHYLERLERYRRRYDFHLYAYVLMKNHVHLLLETRVIPLSKIMQGLQFTYTQYFNRTYRKVGHLFQGRYKAILCDRDAYLLELVRYIHLNPARLRKPRNPWTYPWSSHEAYGGRSTPVEIDTSRVLGQFARRPSAARRAYERFMREGLDWGHESKYYEAVDQRFLGDEKFLDRVEQAVKPRVPVGRRPIRVSLSELFQIVLEVYGIRKEDVWARSHVSSVRRARRMLVYLARRHAHVKVSEIAAMIRRDPTQVSHHYRAYEGAPEPGMEARILSHPIIISHA